jgi:DNA-directed RNA polymerase subunit RPC12/RpoP
MIFVQEILEGIDNLRNLCMDSETEACSGLCPNDKCAVQILYNKLLKHGRWVEHHEPFSWMGYTTWTCSECDYEVGYEKDIKNRTDYCPHCGAKMDLTE